MLLVLFALRDTIVFFHTPKEVVEKHIPPASASASAASSPRAASKRGDGTDREFAITDTCSTIPVSYTGILPDLFREGQGVVAEGKLDPAGRFLADTVLAKHDENYMPPEVAKALKEQGVWQDGKAKSEAREMTADSVTTRMPTSPSPSQRGERVGVRGGHTRRRWRQLAPHPSPSHAEDGRGIRAQLCERHRMIVELGHFALILALAVALVQMALPAWGARTGDPPPDGRSPSRPRSRNSRCWPSPSSRSRTPTSRPTSRSRTCGPTRTRPSRCSTRSPACGGTTRAPCCCGC